MVVCGISGTGRHAAAALAVDGRLVAAAEQAPLARRASFDCRLGSGLPREAIDACLAAAGLNQGDISSIVHADGYESAMGPLVLGGGSSAVAGSVPTHRLSRLAAFAQTARAAGARAVVVADGAAAVLVDGDGVSTPLLRASSLLALVCRLAEALGFSHDDSAEAILELEQLAAGSSVPTSEWFEAMAPIAEGPVVDADAFERALRNATAEAGAALNDAAIPHVRRARVVAELANGFLSMIAGELGRAAASVDAGVMLAGGAFQSPEFVARVQAAAGVPCRVAPWPCVHGPAIGAALTFAAAGNAALPSDLALGPIADEADAKAVLENCRLDYVYEPQWPRLLQRVSRVLQKGKIVAWLQGRAEFGFPFNGSRSYLCDPSNRYARDNINVFLRRQPVSAPIPLSIASNARDCIDDVNLSPWALSLSLVRPEWRERLRAGVNAQGYGRVHVSDNRPGPFADLLNVHWERTGVPGLANLPLCAPDDEAGISPRDAVRIAFASSADALVMHRFVVMKDHWQMRDEM
jgi:carbamoyltransferase